jgi:hypothetical protein
LAVLDIKLPKELVFLYGNWLSPQMRFEESRPHLEEEEGKYNHREFN